MVELTYSPNLPIHINDTDVNKSTLNNVGNTNFHNGKQIAHGSKIIDKEDGLSEVKDSKSWTKTTGPHSNALVNLNNKYNKASSHDYKEITNLFPKNVSTASYKRISIDSNGRTVDSEDGFINSCKFHLSDPYNDDSASEDNFLVMTRDKNKKGNRFVLTVRY